MSMSDTDWQRIAMGLREWFPAGDRWAASDGPEAYRLHLDTVHGLDPAATFGALVSLSRTQKFRPSPGEILERVQGKPGAGYADPEQAWPLIEQAIGMIPGATTDPAFAARHQAAVDWLRTQDECVAAWAAQRGLRGRGSLGMEEVHHPQYGAAALKRLSGDYASVRERAAERLALGHEAFAPRAFLVRSAGGSGGLAGLLDRLRPVDAPALEVGTGVAA